MKNKIQKVAGFHKAYEKNVLNDRLLKKDTYLRDSKEALFFIFSLSFYQGRKDELSKKYELLARKGCDIYFSENNNILSASSNRLLKKEDLKSEYSEFIKVLHDQGLKKGGDRLMVVSLLNFIQANEEKNIVRFIIMRIKSGDLPKVYAEIDSIWSIGPKIASLILRDIVYIYQLEKYLDDEKSYNYLQPVDTWVHQLAKKLNLINPDRTSIYKDEAKDISLKCFEYGVNPIHFNQAVWYLGTHSLEILLDNLDEIVK